MFFDVVFELFFVLTSFFSTTCTSQIFVCAFAESFWVSVIYNLPPDKQHKTKKHKAVCIQMGDKHKWSKGKNHIPVVYAAICATSVLHKPYLKRTKEKHTNQIAHCIKQNYQKQKSAVNYTCEIKYAKNKVWHYPYHCNKQSLFPWQKFWFCFSCWFKKGWVLFVATNAFGFVWHKFCNKLQRKHNPDEHQHSFVKFKPTKRVLPPVCFAQNIQGACTNKQKSAHQKSAPV